MIKIKFKKLFDQAIIPTKKFPTDAGWDVYSIEDVAISAHDQYMVRTGIQLAGVEEHHYVVNDKWEWETPFSPVVLQAWSRSGMDAKKGLHVGAGIIDQNYRGEILVLLKNMSNQTQYILQGDKIAQLVPLYLPFSEVEEVEEVEETDRGESGGITEHLKEVAHA